MSQTELTAETCNDGATSPAIRLSGIGKSFANGNQTIEVLNNVNLTVPPQAIIEMGMMKPLENYLFRWKKDAEAQ